MLSTPKQLCSASWDIWFAVCVRTVLGKGSVASVGEEEGESRFVFLESRMNNPVYPK